MTVVTAHQPNFLPGMSVVSKIAASDFVIWLDRVQYTKGGYTNRNRLPDGSWLTVPVERHCAFKPIAEVRVGSHPQWRATNCRLIRAAWGGGPSFGHDQQLVERVCEEMMRPYGLLVGLNAALLEMTVRELAPRCRWAWQSMLDAGHAVVAVSENEDALLPISDRLAMMTGELGGTVYLSGPSGRHYLAEQPFHERGIAVEYWQHEGPNPCVMGPLTELTTAA